ncbi:hypothetical protein ACFOEE_13750 [Pseudoalteromonas fenneropenaei]|uniref:Uncharacterized protein n=1 Tax=Pseudoalteromonas fenneropenaei TaxID=1737459 RepID=A0ABV7CLT8_9GAMM
MSETITPKRLGLIEILGILLFPYICAWFTLRQGVSTKARVLSFGWMALALMLLFQDDRPSKPTQIQANTPAPSHHADVKTKPMQQDTACEPLFEVEDDNVLSQGFCYLQKVLLTELYATNLKVMNATICAESEKFINLFGSREAALANINESIAQYSRGESSLDPKGLALAQAGLTACRNNETKSEYINNLLQDISIYSRGTFTSPNTNSCEGLIIKQSQSDGFNYTLFASSDCKPSFSNIFHPKYNASGRAQSEALKEINYSGRIPSTWVWQGKNFKF